VITGLSGSGKSSLAIDTEGQHRYVESLSAYARQFRELDGIPIMKRVERFGDKGIYGRQKLS